MNKIKIKDFLDNLVMTRNTVAGFEEKLSDYFLQDVEFKTFKGSKVRKGLADDFLTCEVAVGKNILYIEVFVLPTREKKDNEIVYFVTDTYVEFN